VPLSEEELRLLEQMERALVQEDPKLASTLRGTTFRQSARRRAIFAGVGFAVGVGVLIAGAYYKLIPLGIAGFVIMVGAATMALAALRGPSAATESRAPESPARGFTLIEGGRSRRRTPRTSRSQSGSFMERMEGRWRRRRDERGGT